MAERQEVVVIGAGQAGLAISHQLSRRGVDHVVLERGRVGQTWRGRWDSFCLVTPNWTLDLPGHPYDGDDPDGFLPRDGIVSYLERYADLARIREGVTVLGLDLDGEGFKLRTDAGEISARQVVLATGAYQRPHRPPAAETLPAALHVIDAESYTNPGNLPDGGVLVVGSGQTGGQIAEELEEAGRETFLACGKAGWMPRRLGGEDIFRWLARTPFFEQRLSDLPSAASRLGANPQASGHHGGRDMHFRTLRAAGVQLLGRFTGGDSARVHFADDIAQSLAFGDARYDDIRTLITESCSAQGITAPAMPDPEPIVITPPESIEVSRLGSVIFTSGFRPDYGSWVNVPTFDDMGFPLHRDGASTVAPGLYFVGVHFMRKRKSSLLMGVGEDAALVAEQVAG